MKHLEFQYSGGLKLEKILVRKDAIISVQKTISGNYGCIISLSNGEKHPVGESYENVVSMLKD